MKKFVINSTIKTYPKRHPYESMKRAVLGANYQLTLNFIGPDRARSLNEAYRHKSYVPNVLSFPLDDTAGEIYICPAVSKREAKKFNLSETGYIAYLFIHGLLHLTGLDHGKKMDTLEHKYLKSFSIS